MLGSSYNTCIVSLATETMGHRSNNMILSRLLHSVITMFVGQREAIRTKPKVKTKVGHV